MTIAETDEHLAALRAMNTREEAADYVANLRGAALKAVASELHVDYGTVAQQRARIVDATAGTREDTAAIHSNAWR